MGWFSTGDQYESIINHTTRLLAPGNYSIDVVVNYSSVDTFKEYTVSLYAPKKIKLVNAKGLSCERHNKTFVYDFITPDVRPDQHFVN